MSSPSRPDPLELRGLEVRYGAVRAVDGVDLTVREGEIVALLGPSGCGKTTLLRAVAGFEPAHRGEVLIDGEVVESERTHVPPHRRPVGLVFQDYALFPHRTVAANVAYGLGRHPLGVGGNRAHAERVRELLAMAGLEGLEKRYPHQLSGGQQQRVALLRSLAPRPRVLLLDEPFSNLDPLRRQEIRTQVAALLRAEGVSAILVTHDRADALALADRVAVMDAGRILQCGTGEEVYLRPATPEVASMLGDVQYIDAHVEGGMAATPLGPVRVAGPIQQGAAKILARPEWIIPCAGGACVSVVARQPEGALTRLAVRTADGSTLEMLAPTAWVSHAGDEVAVAITMALPAFDAQGGGAGAAD
jgi:ABC-type Fe3+/spermidine/putrescine transport system ATPase subunit